MDLDKFDADNFFDQVIVNDDLEEAIEKITAVFEKEFLD